MKTKLSAIGALIYLNILVLIVAGYLLPCYGQDVVYLKGEVKSPPNLREGNLLNNGEVITTAEGSRVILSYSKPLTSDGRRCVGWVIINEKETYKVPRELFPNDCPVGGSKEDLKLLTGIRTVVFYTPPGANHVPGLPPTPRYPTDERMSKEWVAFEKTLDEMPRTFLGKLKRVEEEFVVIEDAELGRDWLFIITPNTEKAGVKQLVELIDLKVYIEYVKRYPVRHGTPNEAILIRE